MEHYFGSSWFWFICIGLGGGILSGTLGVGAGVALIPVLAILMKMPQKTAQGMALLIMVPMTLMAGIRYYLNPTVGINLKIVILVAIFAIIGANIGSSIAFALSESLLKKIFAIFIITSGVIMFFK